MSSISQTIDQATGSVMSELQLSPDKRRLIRGHLIDFMIDYRNTVKADIKVVQIYPIPQSLIIPFPKSYIAYSKIGWVVDGQVKIVAQNKNIAKILTYDQVGAFRGIQSSYYNNPSGDPVPDVTVGVPYQNLYNQGVGYQTGTISGAIIPELSGFFMEDLDSKCIRLSTVNAFPNFYMEYVSDCFSPTSETIIHPYAYLFAKAYARWKYLSFAHNTPIHQIERAAKECDDQEIKCKRLMKPMDVISIISSFDKWVGANE